MEIVPTVVFWNESRLRNICASRVCRFMLALKRETEFLVHVR